MPKTHVRGEMHGCVVCGRLYQLYVVYDDKGGFLDCKVMNPDAEPVHDSRRPLVACRKHSREQIEAALVRAYGRQGGDE